MPEGEVEPPWSCLRRILSPPPYPSKARKIQQLQELTENCAVRSVLDCGGPFWSDSHELVTGHRMLLVYFRVPRLGYSGAMERELTGWSALLKAEIDRIEREIQWHDSVGISDPTDMSNARAQRLADLREELTAELKGKRVVILGLTHDSQVKGNSKNLELKERMDFLIQKFSPTIIMEEWTAIRPSFASSLSTDAIGYKDVGTPAEEPTFRTFRYHQVNHPAHDGMLGSCWDAPAMSEYGPLDKQENREQRMLQNIRREMEEHQVGIFLVGLAHLHSMSMKLQAFRFRVAAYAWLGQSY